MNIPIVTIGSISEQIRGVSYSKTDASDIRLEGYLPILRAGNITESGLTFDDLVFVPSGKISNIQKIKKNDILIAASSGSLSVVGKAARALDDFNGGFGAFCKVLRPNAKVDPAYFANYFFTSEYRRKISSVAAGANINNLRNSDIDDLEIPLPPLAEQKRIAAILDKADAIRRKRQQAIELADEFLRSVFLDMFGDPVTNPKGWNVSNIGALCSVLTGSTPSRQENSYFSGNIPWVKTNEVDGYIIKETEEYITEEGIRNSNCKLNPIGSIVLAMYGQGKTRGKVGILGIEAATNQACAVIHPSININMGYLYNYLKLSYETLRALGQGAGQPNLNLSIVKNFSVLMPPIELQREFAKRVEKVEALKAKLKASQLQAEEQFKALSQRAFAGEL